MTSNDSLCDPPLPEGRMARLDRARREVRQSLQNALGNNNPLNPTPTLQYNLQHPANKSHRRATLLDLAHANVELDDAVQDMAGEPRHTSGRWRELLKTYSAPRGAAYASASAAAAATQRPKSGGYPGHEIHPVPSNLDSARDDSEGEASTPPDYAVPPDSSNSGNDADDEVEFENPVDAVSRAGVQDLAEGASVVPYIGELPRSTVSNANSDFAGQRSNADANRTIARNDLETGFSSPPGFGVLPDASDSNGPGDPDEGVVPLAVSGGLGQYYPDDGNNNGEDEKNGNGFVYVPPTNAGVDQEDREEDQDPGIVPSDGEENSIAAPNDEDEEEKAIDDGSNRAPAISQRPARPPTSRDNSSIPPQPTYEINQILEKRNEQYRIEWSSTWIANSDLHPYQPDDLRPADSHHRTNLWPVQKIVSRVRGRSLVEWQPTWEPEGFLEPAARREWQRKKQGTRAHSIGFVVRE
ncbi:Hypothetical predicted protein [Lecanosticta acicola]|uniref:Uncharacterized protein n=1 Tax=Lecanosticta acicola TaxID=111012 RepID=A0AAI8Z5Y5_9PEZI|nr:Hypothetical predicted protein [Lecanosticta acicola]